MILAVVSSAASSYFGDFHTFVGRVQYGAKIRPVVDAQTIIEETIPDGRAGILYREAYHQPDAVEKQDKFLDLISGGVVTSATLTPQVRVAHDNVSFAASSADALLAADKSPAAALSTAGKPSSTQSFIAERSFEARNGVSGSVLQYGATHALVGETPLSVSTIAQLPPNVDIRAKYEMGDENLRTITITETSPDITRWLMTPDPRLAAMPESHALKRLMNRPYTTILKDPWDAPSRRIGLATYMAAKKSDCVIPPSFGGA